jgi:hypothetical protein
LILLHISIFVVYLHFSNARIQFSRRKIRYIRTRISTFRHATFWYAQSRRTLRDVPPVTLNKQPSVEARSSRQRPIMQCRRPVIHAPFPSLPRMRLSPVAGTLHPSIHPHPTPPRHHRHSSFAFPARTHVRDPRPRGGGARRVVLGAPSKREGKGTEPNQETRRGRGRNKKEQFTGAGLRESPRSIPPTSSPHVRVL